MGHDEGKNRLARDWSAILTRRGLLKRTGWIIASAAVPGSAEMAFAEDISPVMAQLSAYMSQARIRELPFTSARVKAAIGI